MPQVRKKRHYKHIIKGDCHPHQFLSSAGVDLRGSGEIRPGPKVCVSGQTRDCRGLRDDHRRDGQRRQQPAERLQGRRQWRRQQKR